MFVLELWFNYLQHMRARVRQDSILPPLEAPSSRLTCVFSQGFLAVVPTVNVLFFFFQKAPGLDLLWVFKPVTIFHFPSDVIFVFQCHHGTANEGQECSTFQHEKISKVYQC